MCDRHKGMPIVEICMGCLREDSEAQTRHERSRMLEEICQYIESLGENPTGASGIPRPWLQRYPGLAQQIRQQFTPKDG
jgi:hypothetical protein